jgi:hypothetical protein
VVHGTCKRLATIAALAAALLVLALSVAAVLLLLTAASLTAATTTAEAAPSATSVVALAAGLLGRSSGQSRSVTAGLWWGRKIRLWREILFVVHYFLRYGGQFAESLRREQRVKSYAVGFQNQLRPVEDCNRTSTHERDINFS